jgi:hypothetical protein
MKKIKVLQAETLERIGSLDMKWRGENDVSKDRDILRCSHGSLASGDTIFVKITMNVIVQKGFSYYLEVLMRLIKLTMPFLECCSSIVRRRWTVIECN